MLFPLMIGVGAGVALERYYLAKRRSKKFWERMKKDTEKKQNQVEDEAKDAKTAESIMDYINKAKKSHPQVYDDCKIGIWIAIIITVLFSGWLLTTILSKISFIPVFLLFGR